MPVTALQAILAALATLSDEPGYRIISEMPSDEACAIVAQEGNGVTHKETFDGAKWTRYTCDGKYPWDKGTITEYEVIMPDSPEDEDEQQEQQYKPPAPTPLSQEDMVKAIRQAQENVGKHLRERLANSPEFQEYQRRLYQGERDELDRFIKNTTLKLRTFRMDRILTDDLKSR